MAKRTISINKEAYVKLSEYCKENTLVMSSWAEKLLLETINNNNESNKYEYYLQKHSQDSLNEGSSDNPSLQAMGHLDWQLCGISGDMFIYKRKLIT